ncbi:MAG: 2-C-methyl-D-erythritol 2,4-cyclodiphosphate synthase [Candidatus Riflebacteria bacterium]|nr:2-C-methyl-D-erythritol 2,4-cyclodiphosphate synthase [Candidatus Riflebacteria bacterium]
MKQKFRIGYGEDIHRLVPQRDLWLGGVRIPFELGLLGHSDADVLLHAIMDAMLGALALGDIGSHFPDTDEKFRGISSLILLEKVYRMLKDSGYSIGNIDSMIICEKPKIKPFSEQIREKISRSLNIDTSQISLKAGTNEKLDSAGRGECIIARAIVLLERQ